MYWLDVPVLVMLISDQSYFNYSDRVGVNFFGSGCVKCFQDNKVKLWLTLHRQSDIIFPGPELF